MNVVKRNVIAVALGLVEIGVTVPMPVEAQSFGPIECTLDGRKVSVWYAR